MLTDMTRAVERRRFILYLQIGGAYLLLWLLIDLVSNTETFFKRLVNNTWLISYLTVINFVLFEYTLPFIKLQWKRILVAPVLLFGHMILHSFIFYAWRLIGIALNIYFPLITHSSTEKGIEYHMPYSMMSIFFFGVIRYTYDYRKLKEAAQQLRIEKQEAELNYLKSQTNPHFLFNTLNNIYSLAKDKSDLAPESILRLSKILRYMLYETSGPYIAIEQELKIINDYIELEKLRYDESLRVNFNYTIEDMRQALPPLLLMPLVENAFKHGASETRSNPFVEIHLSVQHRQLTFVVKNSSGGSTGDQGVRENIGLSNLRRQLELLYSAYSLTTEHKNSIFTASLTINLASHV
jgi:two-component system, LytTR family, sensor kinase